MMVGVFVAPLALLIWRDSRKIAIAALIAGIASAFAVGSMYDMGGYTKLLGLPHVLFYTPLAYVVWTKLRDGNLPVWPKRIMWVMFITLMITLAFDYTDVLRYLLGARTPMPDTI